MVIVSVARVSFPGLVQNACDLGVGILEIRGDGKN